MNDDALIDQVYRKIEREKVIINAANAMRASSNRQVQASLDAQVREARKGIEYLEERMRELQLRRMEQSSSSQQSPIQSTSSQYLSSRERQSQQDFDDQGDYGDPGNGGYMNDLSGGHGMMPPRAPFGPPGPVSVVPKSRPNYTKLGRMPDGEGLS